MPYPSRHLLPAFCLIALLCLMSGVSLAADVAPTPTIADARQQFTDGKFTDVIKSISKITASRDWQAKKSDAYDLYIMKAEAHLHLKENALASSSFDLAAKAAADQVIADKALIDKTTKEKPAEPALVDKYATDRANAGLARASAYLVKHSAGLFFIPKATANQRVAGGSPDEHVKIDILAPDSRKTALTAVWTDQKNAAAPTITQATATDDKSIQAVLDAAPMIPNLRDFDFGANGNDEDTTKTASAIAEHGRDLLQEMLAKMMIRYDLISSEANTVERSRAGLPSGGYENRYKKHGLEGSQGAELKTMMDTTTKVATAVKILSDGLSTETGFFDKVTKDAKRIHDGADKMLKTDYSQTYLNKNTAMLPGS